MLDSGRDDIVLGPDRGQVPQVLIDCLLVPAMSEFERPLPLWNGNAYRSAMTFGG